MLTVMPPSISRLDDQEVAMRVVRFFERWTFNWERILLDLSATFHLVVAIRLLMLPPDQVLTPASEPVFALADQYAWAVSYLALAVALFSLRWPRPQWVMITVWLATVLVGGMWTASFALAIARQDATGVGIVAWPFLYVVWWIVGARMILGKR